MSRWWSEETEMALPPSAVVGVRVQIDEPVLRQRVTSAGGQWHPQARVWEMPFGAAQALDLEDSIAVDPHLPPKASTSADL